MVPGAPQPRTVPASNFFHEPIEFAQLLKPTLKPNGAGVIHLMPETADLHGQNIRELFLGGESDYIGDWKGTDNLVSWNFIAAKANYDVHLEFAAADECDGGSCMLWINGATINATISKTGSWTNWTTLDLGKVQLAGGNEILSLKPTVIPHTFLMNLKSITLTPATTE